MKLIASAIEVSLKLWELALPNKTYKGEAKRHVKFLDTRPGPDSSFLPAFQVQHFDYKVQNTTSLDDTIYGQSLVMALDALS